MAPGGEGPGPSGGVESSNTNKRLRGAGSGASRCGKAGQTGSQGEVSKGAGMHSSHGWGRRVPREVSGPGVIDSSIIFVWHLILRTTNAY